ncbi:2-polyprenylphenol hydroxylase [Corynebacterium gallinarum]|nr:2-polyprenylphenol hydroxylase [Corynebacterium gallinarum]
MDNVTPRPMRPVTSLIEDNPDVFLATVMSRLSTLDPLAYTCIPHVDDQTHISITELLAAMLDGVGDEGAVDPGTVEYFRDLARDYRRFGFTPQTFTTLGESLRLALREVGEDLPFETELFAERAITATTSEMAAAAQESIDAGIPAATDATVVQVERRSRRFIVVRLEADGPLSYFPGQYLPVTAGYLQNSWRFLCPSIPANEWGQVEFHIQTGDDEALRLLAGSQPGDRWSIGLGQGEFGQRLFGAGSALVDASPGAVTGDGEPGDDGDHGDGGGVDKQDDLLFIAYGTGLAPLRAMMFELMTRTYPPRLHFFVGAEYPGELYELMGLWNFAATCPWLSVVPVTTNAEDAWWVQATEASQPPRGLHLTQVGQMAEIVTSVGSWADRDVLIAGPEQMARDIRRALIRRGTPRDRIEHLEF